MSPLQLFRAYTTDSGAVFNDRCGFLARGSGIRFDPNNSQNKAKTIVERHLNWDNTTIPSPLISASTQAKAKRIAASLRRKHPRSTVYIAQIVYEAEESSTMGPKVYNMCALARKLGVDNDWKDGEEYVFVNQIPLSCILEVSQVVEWTKKLFPSKYTTIWLGRTATFSLALRSAEIRLLSQMMATVSLQKTPIPAAPPVSVSVTLSLFRAFTRTTNTDSTLDPQYSFVAGNTAMRFDPVGNAGEATSILENHLDWNTTRIPSPLISASSTFDKAKKTAARLRKSYPGETVYIAEVVFDQKKKKLKVYQLHELARDLGISLEQYQEGYVFVQSIPRKFVLNVRQVATWNSKGKPSTYNGIWKNYGSPYYPTIRRSQTTTALGD